MESFGIIVICVVPATIGFLLARYCSQHRLATLGFIIATIVLIFCSSVRYAAIPGAFVTSICTLVGYWLGRIVTRSKHPHGDD